MARNKSSKFGVAEGLFTPSVNEEIKPTQEVQEVSTISTSVEGYKPEIVFGATQGKKGHKASRINMAFSPENHEWLKKHSRELGISATELANEQYELYEREKNCKRRML